MQWVREQNVMRLYGQRRVETTERAKKMRSFTICNLITHAIRITKTKMVRCAGYVKQIGYKRNAYKILAGKSVWNRALSRHKR